MQGINKVLRKVVAGGILVAPVASGVNAPAGAVGSDTKISTTPVDTTQPIPAPTPVEPQKAGMTLTGFDPAAAARNGYTVRTLFDGTEITISNSKLAELGSKPTDSALEANAEMALPVGTTPTPGTDAVVQPTNYVYGNCGDSFFFLHGVHGKWTEDTGYDITHPAYYFDWETHITGSHGANFADLHGWSSNTSGTSKHISTGWDYHNDPWTQLGLYTGEVMYGHAYLVNGGICSSIGPADSFPFTG